MRWIGIAGSVTLTLWAVAFGGCRTDARPATGPQARVLDVLAQGSRSEVEEPWVGVVRDAATYAELRAASRIELPDRPAEFFSTHAVVAVCLGIRPTPGYRVSLRESASGIEVAEDEPPRDAVLSQVLTAPFVVAAIPVGPEADVRLSLPGRLRGELRSHRVDAARFEVSGGIAGIRSTLVVSGEVRTARLGSLATALVDLLGVSAERKGHLRAALTGVASPDGSVLFGRIRASTLVPPPCAALAVSGAVSPETGALTLRVASVPCAVADAFAGAGTFEATPVGKASPGR